MSALLSSRNRSHPPPPTWNGRHSDVCHGLLCCVWHVTTSAKSDERKSAAMDVPAAEKSEKKERSGSSKASKEKNRGTSVISGDVGEEREPRKERKVARKRDRPEEAILLAEQKRRKDEEKVAAKLQSHQNGEPMEQHGRDKHHYTSSNREKSPYVRERERSHDRDGRDKHRRSSEAKRR